MAFYFCFKNFRQSLKLEKKIMSYLNEPENFMNSLSSISSSLKAQPQYQPIQKLDQLENSSLQNGNLLQQMTYDLQQQNFSGLNNSEHSFTQANMLCYQNNYNSYNQLTNQIYSSNFYNNYNLSNYQPVSYQNQIPTQNLTSKLETKSYCI